MLRICNHSILNSCKRQFIFSKVTSVLVNDRKNDGTVPVFFLFKDFLHPEFFNVIAISKFFESFNSVLGLPWYVSVISGTIVLKSVISLPMQILSEKNSAQCKYLYQKLPEMYEKVDIESEKLAKEQNIVELARPQFKESMRKQYKKHIFAAHKCHPFKSLVLNLFQVPLWITTTFTFRSILVKDSFTEALQKGGALWFTDLTVPDCFLFFPLLGLVGNYINQQLNFSRIPDPTKITRVFRWIGIGSCVIMFIFSSCMPTMLVLYWTTSSCCHMINNFLLLSPKVRQFLKIRKLDTDFERPYNRFWNLMRTGKA